MFCSKYVAALRTRWAGSERQRQRQKQRQRRGKDLRNARGVRSLHMRESRRTQRTIKQQGQQTKNIYKKLRLNGFFFCFSLELHAAQLVMIYEDANGTANPRQDDEANPPSCRCHKCCMGGAIKGQCDKVQFMHR